MINKMKKVCKWILKLLPIRNYILMESSPDFSDNVKTLLEHLIKNNVNKRYKIIWLLNKNKTDLYPNIKNIIFCERNSKNILKKIKCLYYEYSAKIIIDCNVYVYKRRNKQIRIYLGHGMPMKVTTMYSGQVGECNYILSLSDFFINSLSKIYKTKKEQIISLGYPRNDELIIYRNKDINLDSSWKSKKIIVWLPTYRKHSNKESNINVSSKFIYGIPCFEREQEFMEINTLLKKNNILLLIKLHPAQDMNDLESFKNTNLQFITDNDLQILGITLYQLLSKSSALITDYSTVYYDYLLTQNPIGLAISDLDDYIEKVGIIYNNYYDAIKGEYIYSIKDLKRFIINVSLNIDIKKDEREELMNKYHKYIDSNSSERVYKLIKEYL